MKSLQVTRIDLEEADSYSELKVMKSPAGYYVGTTYHNSEFGFDEPGSRDSGYFRTEEEAAAMLKTFESGDHTHVRWNP